MNREEKRKAKKLYEAMKKKIKKDDNDIKKKEPTMWENIKRIRTEIILIINLSILILFLPSAAQLGLMALFITKTMFVTIGVLYAHASRKFLFPYIDLKESIYEHHWGVLTFASVWYGVILWAFAIGG